MLVEEGDSLLVPDFILPGGDFEICIRLIPTNLAVKCPATLNNPEIKTRLGRIVKRYFKEVIICLRLNWQRSVRQH